MYSPITSIHFDKAWEIFRKHPDSQGEMTLNEFCDYYQNLYKSKPPTRQFLLQLCALRCPTNETIRLAIEKEDICEQKECDCHMLHVDENDICPNYPTSIQCTKIRCKKVHVPKESLCERVMGVFRKSQRDSMTWGYFSMKHRELYPHLHQHQPSRNTILLRYDDLVAFTGTNDSPKISLLKERPPTAFEHSMDRPFPSIKLRGLDPSWTNTNELIVGIKSLFNPEHVKDIYIPGHVRVAYVTLETPEAANACILQCHHQWCHGRLVSIIGRSSGEIQSKIEGDKNKICVAMINGVMTRRDLMKWFQRTFNNGKILKMEFDYLRCYECSADAYVHLSSSKVISEILQEFQKTPQKYKINNKCVYVRSSHSGLRFGETRYKYPPTWEDYSGHYKHHPTHTHGKSIASQQDIFENSNKNNNNNNNVDNGDSDGISTSSHHDTVLEQNPSNTEEKKVDDVITNDGSHGGNGTEEKIVHDNNNNNNNTVIEEEEKDKFGNDGKGEVMQSMASPSSQPPAENNNRRHEKPSTQPTEILVQRLKLLVQNIMGAEEDLQQRLSLIGVVGNGINLDNDSILNGKRRRASSPRSALSNNQDEPKFSYVNGNGQYANSDNAKISEKTEDAFETQLMVLMKDKDLQIESLKDILSQMRKDQNQIQVYRKALQAFQHSQSRTMHKALQDLKPLDEKEAHLVGEVSSLQEEITKLQKQLKSLCQQEQIVQKEIDMLRRQRTLLQDTVTSVRCKLEPVTKCLIAINAPAVLAKEMFPNVHSNGHDNNDHHENNRSNSTSNALLGELPLQRKVPNEKRLNDLEHQIALKEAKLSYWMRWDEWSLEEVIRWIMDLENGRFQKYTTHLQGLSRISEGSILTAITDVTLQLLGINHPKDRSDILHYVNTLKKRTKLLQEATMQRKSISSRKIFDLKPIHVSSNKPDINRAKIPTSPLSPTSVLSPSQENINSDFKENYNTKLTTEEEEENLCVICLDRKCGPFACVPCGHQCLCEGCKDILENKQSSENKQLLENKPSQQQSRCPICNDNITMILKLFKV